VSGHELSTRNALTTALKTLPRYIGLAFITIVVVALAFLLLILPGVWALIALSFSSFFLVLEHESIINSMKKSFSLTNGKLWFVTFGNFIALGIVFFVMTLILNLVSEIFFPATLAYAISSGIADFFYICSTIFMYTLFLYLKKLRSENAETTS
jgi:hypothetical protein